MNLGTAPSWELLQRWCQRMGYNHREWRYVSRPEDLRGYSAGTVLHVIDGYPRSLHNDGWILSYLQHLQIRTVTHPLDETPGRYWLVAIPWRPEKTRGGHDPLLRRRPHPAVPR